MARTMEVAGIPFGEVIFLVAYHGVRRDGKVVTESTGELRNTLKSQRLLYDKRRAKSEERNLAIDVNDMCQRAWHRLDLNSIRRSISVHLKVPLYGHKLCTSSFYHKDV